MFNVKGIALAKVAQGLGSLVADIKLGFKQGYEAALFKAQPLLLATEVYATRAYEGLSEATKVRVSAIKAKAKPAKQGLVSVLKKLLANAAKFDLQQAQLYSALLTVLFMLNTMMVNGYVGLGLATPLFAGVLAWGAIACAVILVVFLVAEMGLFYARKFVEKN